MLRLISSLRKVYRVVLFGLWLIVGIFLTLIFLRNTMPTHGLQSRIVKKWLGRAAHIFGVKNKILRHTIATKNPVCCQPYFLAGYSGTRQHRADTFFIKIRSKNHAGIRLAGNTRWHTLYTNAAINDLPQNRAAKSPQLWSSSTIV